LKYFITLFVALGSALFIRAQSTANCISKDYGVNLSGGEFGSNEPGTDGVDYTYPKEHEAYTYFSANGFSLIRLPFGWERVQNSAFAALSTNDINGIKRSLDSAQAHGLKVILDMHNFARYYNIALTESDSGKLADVWSKLVAQFMSHPALYGYEIMNEPHDLTGDDATWFPIAQAVVNAIRKVDVSHFILIPGYSWQSADRWASESDELKNIKDPADITRSKILFSAHQYFDSDASGTYSSSCSDTTIGATRVQHFIDWLTTNNAKGILTEYGIPSSTCWESALHCFLTKLNSSDRIVGGTYWSAGPWWGGYQLSVEPNSDGVSNSHSQMNNVLLNFPSVNCLTSVEADLNFFDVKAFPNPFDQQIQLDINLKNSDKSNGTISVCNVLGEEIIKQDLAATAGRQSVVLHTEAISKGIYLIRLSFNNTTSILKVVK